MLNAGLQGGAFQNIMIFVFDKIFQKKFFKNTFGYLLLISSHIIVRIFQLILFIRLARCVFNFCLNVFVLAISS